MVNVNENDVKDILNQSDLSEEEYGGSLQKRIKHRQTMNNHPNHLWLTNPQPLFKNPVTAWKQ